MVVTPILVVDRALRDAGIPIDGVSMGDPVNRATWRVFYSASATPAQRAQGDALLTTLDPQDPVTIANVKADLSITLADTEVLKAVTQALWECIPVPTLTKIQLRARILQLLRS